LNNGTQPAAGSSPQGKMAASILTDQYIRQAAAGKWSLVLPSQF